MSLASKFFSTFIQSSQRAIIWRNAPCQSIRNFHIMVKPIPMSLCLPKMPMACDVITPTSLASGIQRLLTPISTVLHQVAGFKVKGRLKRRCKDCYFVIRQQRHYVICPTHRRHKQMSMKKRDYKSWILTHATQSRVRPY
ncbi:large ribosomal subunit protein bL36m [Stomoxys calcitrans]|uniref:Large ribosomal subunit protein bL36m n=1 Tax=Stomoxys calcitrans TaxID=35570 RepID=A0A1I8NMV1_STOCA|nr:large ribosomal subunit protein bL36m [Stomoxys calcitrans]